MELTVLWVCTYSVISEYGQMRSYTGSVSERILLKDSLYQTALPRFHMPDIPPLVIYFCELSTVFLQGRSCLKLYFSLFYLVLFFLSICQNTGQRRRKWGISNKNFAYFQNSDKVGIASFLFRTALVLSPLSKQ